MKAITICQPFAHLIVAGDKRVENRKWPTRYRGPLAIHAGKSRAWLRGEKPTPEMAFGAVVGVADMVDCLHIFDIEDGHHDAQYPWLRTHPHTEGLYCFVLSNVRRIQPVPAKGALGFWEWDPLGMELIR